jgi:peptidoglycan/LPS O-acetylase OafA/YrhL
MPHSQPSLLALASLLSSSWAQKRLRRGARRGRSHSVDPVDATPTLPAPRLWSLDVLRGGCALAVFLCHWHLWSDFTPHGALQSGVRAFLENGYNAFVTLTWPTGGHHPAVICFFVLSGFCIHYPVAQRELHGRPHPPWRGYFRRRFLRIMPAFWAACLLGIVFVIAQSLHPANRALLAQHATGSVGEIIARFAGVSGFYPQEIFAGNYPLTTVAVEIMMYALYPWFHFHALRHHWAGLGVAFALLQAVAVLLLGILSPYWMFNSVLMMGLFWYLGAFAAYLYVSRRARIHGAWFLSAWLGFLWLKTVPHFYGLNVLRQDAWAIVCTLGMLWALGREASHPLEPEYRPVSVMRFFGKISYSLYAMHTPAIMLATWMLVVVVHTQDYFVQLATAFAFSALATLLTYRFVEQAFYRPRSE